MGKNVFYFYSFLIVTSIMIIFDTVIIINFINAIKELKSFELIIKWLEEYIGVYKGTANYTRGAWYLFVSLGQVIILIICVKYIIKNYKEMNS
ncbi:MAG: hypothetical protein LBG95_02680 [Treponema sp.]|jgi:hypothetical protein|nr:hypothetical protein [Treponema sp.]